MPRRKTRGLGSYYIYYELQQRIKELEEEIQDIKDMQHNHGMRGAALAINKELRERATTAELKFKHIAELKHLHLKFQYRINIYAKRRIKKFYFADFCDIRYRLIFEVDGGYHSTPEQQRRDLKRTRDLVKAGYKVFRITNEEIFEGKTTNFLINAYKSIGIQI